MKAQDYRFFAGSIVIGVLVVICGGLVLVRGVRNLVLTRRAVVSYSRLIASSNAQDLATIRSLCSERYLSNHPLSVARGGGVVGFPRQIHPNYQVWVEGPEIWLCPGNRMGQVVRFVLETGTWKFAGVAGMLRADGRVIPTAAVPESSRGKP